MSSAQVYSQCQGEGSSAGLALIHCHLFLQPVSQQRLQQCIQRAARTDLPPGRQGAASSPRRAQCLQVRSQEGLGAQGVPRGGRGLPGAWGAPVSTQGNRVWVGTGDEEKCDRGSGRLRGTGQGLQGILHMCTAPLQQLLTLPLVHALPLLCLLFSIFPFAGCTKLPLSGKCLGSACVCSFPARCSGGNGHCPTRCPHPSPLPSDPHHHGVMASSSPHLLG